MPRLFGEKLRFLRNRSGITQVELAHRLLLASYTHITKIEANQDAPSLDLVIRVSQLLGVTTDYLLRDTIPVEEVTTIPVDALTSKTSSIDLFAVKLRFLRHKAGFTQVELMRQLGLTGQGYISNLEGGRKAPSLDLIVKVANLFQVTTDYLLCETISVPMSTQDLGSGTP